MGRNYSGRYNYGRSYGGYDPVGNSDRGANDEGYDNPRFVGEDGNQYSYSPPPLKVKKTTAIINKYVGKCSGCGDAVPVGKGFAEKFNGKWKPFCTSCFTDRRS